MHRVGSLSVAACEELGVKPGSSYGKLKSGQSVLNQHGELVHPEQVPDLLHPCADWLGNRCGLPAAFFRRLLLADSRISIQS